ncbi:FAD-binding domain-containing protein [Serendipita vermifera]|nr:FAD-binding domain-containing protein [Serendipita vermifera]
MRVAALSTLVVLALNSSCWPSQTEWNLLNVTLRGSLARARPPAYPCHEPNYNETQCQTVKQNWTSQFWRAQQPGAYFDTAWENGDSYCGIDNNATVPCDQGLVPIYVAQAKSVTDVQIAVKFAALHRLSTRVKGASHDFLGRSSGNGTFAIQTINLKGIEFVDSFRPSGAPSSLASQSVAHIGAGEHWWYVYKAADEHGVIIVGGSSYSVGAAGGWILGGGHSSLSPQYGLGVDNVLQFEVVTPDGVLRTANAYKNSDLFWALRGGGPGFGVVTKVTYKTYPAIKSIVNLNVAINYTSASYRGLLKTYLLLQPAISARNFTGYTYPIRSVDPATSTTIFNALWFVHNSADITGANSTIQPLYDFIKNETAAGRPMSISTRAAVLGSYLQMWPATPETANENSGAIEILGSRLLPVSAFQGNVDGLVDLLATTPLVPMFNHVSGGKVHTVAPDATAANPSWRNAIHHLIFISRWTNTQSFSVRQAIRASLTSETQKLAALFPGQGCYVNEYNEPNWKQTFWGSNYNRLAIIKKIYDPLGIFTCYHCVGDDS